MKNRKKRDRPLFEAATIPDLDLKLPDPRKIQQLEDHTKRMLVLLAEMDMGLDYLATIIDVFLDVPPNLIRYLAGPIVVSGGQGGAWGADTPERALKAAKVARVEQVLTELQTGEILHYATPAEVLCAMYGYSMCAPMHRDWSDVYLWCGCQAAVRNGWAGIKTEEDWWKQMGEEYPPKFDRIKQDFHQIAADIRRKVIDGGKAKGWGDRRQRKRDRQEQADAKAAVLLPPQSSTPPQPNTTVEEFNLFDLI